VRTRKLKRGDHDRERPNRLTQTLRAMREKREGREGNDHKTAV
jgi:hypothetical protein